MKFAHTFRNYDKKNLAKDIPAGLIIMAVSIPISMGYAQIAGLPAVYGLYGSVFPILIFAFFSTSPQFIFGVDAAPAALVGAALLNMNITAGSQEAINAVPVITFFVALWLLVFSLLKAGKLVNFISAPVMGGFISGICTTIILMQIPKIMGGTAGTGELLELAEHIGKTAENINYPSVLLGVAALFILIISKKLIPKFPMAVVLMVAGAALTAILPIRSFGIQTLTAVEPGLPMWRLPDFTAVPVNEVFVVSLSVAIVIMAETLLAENNFAQKNRYKIDDNQEILAFSLGNFLAAFTGCCPINGSVSRTAMGEQYQVKTQLTSIIAGVSMIGILLFGTGFIGYLPIPVLTAIVISALLGATEFELISKLWKVSRAECVIFIGAFMGVLLWGTINGVLIGIVLSFAEMIIRTSKPATCFLGIQPGHRHFRDLAEGEHIHKISGVVIYRFSSNLFFANIQVFQKEIEEAITADTKAVIIDASGIGSIDITAADRLELLRKGLEEKGIKFYITEHISGLNKQLRKLGLGHLIENGNVRRTIHVAIRDIGYNRPYPLEGGVENVERSALRKRVDNRVQEYVWAYGKNAQEEMEKQIKKQLKQLHETQNVNEILHGSWSYMESLDLDEWLEHLEEHLREIGYATGLDEREIVRKIEKYRQDVREHIKNEHPELVERFSEQRDMLDEELKKKNPEAFKLIEKTRKKEHTS